MYLPVESAVAAPRGINSASLLSFLPLILLYAAAAGGLAAAPRPRLPVSSESQPVAGTTLVYFGRVDDGVYKGSKPRSDADYAFLRSKHVKYILDLELLPSLRNAERKKAARYGIQLLHQRINASPFPPSEKHIRRIMAVLKDSRYHSIYFHCNYGRDRTSLIAALYKMYFMGMSPPNALRYLEASGYKDSWVRGGLKKYLREHPAYR